MGGNKTKESSGGDPRGTNQNQINQQVQRYQGQQGPVADLMGQNYARGAEANYGDYTDIMNQYRGIASGAGGAGGGGGGGGASTWGPSMISYKDPFKSYTGFEEFSNTGGYSPTDVANMRARGVSPIRAAYANAEREVGRQRSLQGGYSPNAFALQGRMAREQGQLGADAVQNVEAGLAEARNTGRLKGLEGMSDIEKQRLAADLEVGKFNANAQMSADSSNAGASNAASRANMDDRMDALTGMRLMYGTTPGMAGKFGDQLIDIVGQGGTFGNNTMNSQILASQAPGQFDQTMDRIGKVTGAVKEGMGIASTITDAVTRDRNKQQPTTPIGPSGENFGYSGATGGADDPYAEEARRRGR